MSAEPSRTASRGVGLACVFYFCVFLLSSGGHLGSADAGAQLQASMLLATTGHLLTAVPPATGAVGWQRGPGGAYHEPHDIGNLVLMLPAAWLGRIVTRGAARFDEPPLASRVAAALTCAVAGAIGCVFMFRLFALRARPRSAFLLSLALPATTIYWAYAKTAWDVTGAASAMCAVLYYAVRVSHSRPESDRGTRSGLAAPFAAAFGLGAAAAIACSFRYSLAPFLAVGLAGLLFTARGRLPLGAHAACAAAFLAGLVPSLAYNYVRMGSALVPATASATYLAANNALTGSLARGLPGLFLAPNRGLFIFSPVCALLVALPFVWKKLPAVDRRVLVTIGGGAFLYVLLIAKLENWGGTFGWGPRLLVPVVPVAFYGAVLVMTNAAAWRGWRVAALALLLGASALAALAPVLVNWPLALVAGPRALEQDAPRPYQHLAVWRALAAGVQGVPLAVPPELAGDPERQASRRFPDLWTVRLMERSRGEAAAGLAISLALLAGAILSAAALLSGRRGS